MTGHFFVFDGMDGAGKSTSIAGLAEHLRTQGKPVVCTREPGGSPLAEEIRDCLLRDRDVPMPMASELLLMFAARAAHLEQTIMPALAQGSVVLCDRFVDASHVYQGTLGGADQAWIRMLEQQVVTRHPDQTFIFDLPVDVSVERMAQRGNHNRFDRLDRGRLEVIRNAFRQRVDESPDTHCMIDASGEPAKVLEQLITQVEGAL